MMTREEFDEKTSTREGHEEFFEPYEDLSDSEIFITCDVRGESFEDLDQRTICQMMDKIVMETARRAKEGVFRVEPSFQIRQTDETVRFIVRGYRNPDYEFDWEET